METNGLNLIGAPSEGYGDEDMIGLEDILGDPEVLGALAQARSKRRMIMPGVQNPGGRRQPLGLGSVTFVNGGVTVQTLTVNPQSPYRGKRLVLDRFNVGAASPNLSVTVSDFRIANVPQTLSATAIPVAAFRVDAVDTYIDLDSSAPGVDYFIEFTISAAPAAAETVRIDAAIFGSALR
jgi:hypothetical protein